MHFAEACSLLIEDAVASHAKAHVTPDGIVVRYLPAPEQEVSLCLLVSMYRRSRRQPAYIEPSLAFFSARLQSYPTDQEFLETLAGVPEEQAAALVAARSRLTGHVPLNVLVEPAIPEILCERVGPITKWSREQFSNHLQSLRQATFLLSHKPLPARTAEELLYWAQSAYAGVPALRHLWAQAQDWKVLPRQQSTGAA